MSEAREVFTIFTGQAGTQLASDFWKLLCYENGIDDEGYFLYCRRPSTNASYIPYFVPSQVKFIKFYMYIYNNSMYKNSREKLLVKI